ncbi:hypothetical protein Dimus_005329 [Dionaea muscipula]
MFDAIKEFYAGLTLIHYKKKEVACSSVRGVEIEFDHLKLASILGVPGNNGILKDLELPYGDWLTMVFENFGVPLVDKQGEEPKRYEYFEKTFLSMCQLKRENRVWWLGSGENSRRDDEEVASAEAEEEEEAQNSNFDWEAVVDEATLQGESRSGEKFYDAEDEIQEPAAVVEEVPTVAAQTSAQQKETEAARVDPSGPSSHIPDSIMSNLQADFERARANRIQADLEKAQVENAKLLALLQQAQSKPKP